MPSGIETDNVSVAYGSTTVLREVSLSIPPGKVTALIGPSGCGKSTFLRCLNRMNETIRGCRVQGGIRLDGEPVQGMDPVLLRRKVGMVFQKPNPFPMSIRENVLYGVKATKLRVDHQKVVWDSLSKAALWDEVWHRLGASAWNLSVGQQQRLCIARALATAPDVVLMDEPASSLDPASAAKVEQSICQMRGEYTLVVVTHNMQQAQRIADYTAFFYLGRLVEWGTTKAVFTHAQRDETQAYIEGRFG